MNDSTLTFIKQHRNDDIRQLALTKPASDIDLKLALQQIAGWQTARRKLPDWAAYDNILYPPHLNMEQASSQQTAQYKANVVERWGGKDTSYVDLTGGMGIDFSFMARAFDKRTYVERNEMLCQLAHHNFPILQLEAAVTNDDAEDFVNKMARATVIFIDPARRDEHGARTYGLADCTPDVTLMMPVLREKAEHIVMKLSPMLDWRKAVDDLGGASEVHIVSVKNECKELLLVIDHRASTNPTLICINDEQRFCPSDTTETPTCQPTATDNSALDNTYLYEPNASIMKGGCFTEVERAFAMQQVAANSHLFLSNTAVKSFPGRSFIVKQQCSLNKRELRQALAGIDRANVAVRNFPLSAEVLRKKLKLKDGGDTYIFGTTLPDGNHVLFVCRKIG